MASHAPIKLMGIAGSLRKGSYNKKLLNIALKNLPKGMSMDIFDISGIPLYNADVEAEDIPESVKLLKGSIAMCDGLLISTPEYNRSIAGVMKNVIDWASTPPKTSPLPGKPLAIMGAGGRLGTAFAQAHLRHVAIANNMHVMNKPEVMIHFAAQKFDEQGLLIDAKDIERIRKLLTNFLDFIRLSGI